MPLPLGCNGVRGTGPKVAQETTRIFKRAIEYSLAWHRADAPAYAMKYARGMTDARDADRFVGMYVNDYTVDFGEKGRRAVTLLLNAAIGPASQPSRRRWNSSRGSGRRVTLENQLVNAFPAVLNSVFFDFFRTTGSRTGVYIMMPSRDVSFQGAVMRRFGQSAGCARVLFAWIAAEGRAQNFPPDIKPEKAARQAHVVAGGEGQDSPDLERRKYDDARILAEAYVQAYPGDPEGCWSARRLLPETGTGRRRKQLWQDSLATLDERDKLDAGEISSAPG